MMENIRFFTDRIREGSGGVVFSDKEGKPAPIVLSPEDTQSAAILDFVFENLIAETTTMGEVREWLNGASWWLGLLMATKPMRPSSPQGVPSKEEQTP